MRSFAPCLSSVYILPAGNQPITYVSTHRPNHPTPKSYTNAQDGLLLDAGALAVRARLRVQDALRAHARARHLQQLHDELRVRGWLS